MSALLMDNGFCFRSRPDRQLSSSAGLDRNLVCLSLILAHLASALLLWGEAGGQAARRPGSVCAGNVVFWGSCCTFRLFYRGVYSALSEPEGTG